jgi:ATP-dependent Clp protease adapter protein ClpS
MNADNKKEVEMSVTEPAIREKVSDGAIEAFFDEADLWNIVVWDDPVTTFEQVIRACVELLGHSRKRGRQLADQVDGTGMAVVGTRPHDEAVAIVREFHRRLIQASIEMA